MRMAFVGYGALGKQIRRLIGAGKRAESVTEEIFFDDTLHVEGQASALPFAQFLEERFSDFEFYLGLGYKHLLKKQEILGALRRAGRRLPPIVHATAFVDNDAVVGSSVVICPGCNVDQNAVLGDGTLLHNSVVVSHDSTLGECCYLAPGVVLAGQVRIGAGTFLGAGSVVVNAVEIGTGCTIGAGALVTRDLPSGVSAIGNPLRLLNRPLRLR